MTLASTLRAQASDTYLPWEGGPAGYRNWSNGPRAHASFFPIGVWLQSPSRAEAYKSIGVNQFIGLWKGPTDEQLAALGAAEMPVLASQDPGVPDMPDIGMLRGWILMDEPDNAQPNAGGGYGPCVPADSIVEQYRFPESGPVRDQ